MRVLDGTAEIGRFDPATVTSISVDGGGGSDAVVIDPSVAQAVALRGGAGWDKLVAGGGPAALVGGDAHDALFGRANGITFDGGGANDLYTVFPTDVAIPNSGDRLLAAVPPGPRPRHPSRRSPPPKWTRS